MLEEPSVITRLENKIDELYRDHEIAQKVINKNSSLLMTATAVDEYIALKQDFTIPLGIRYLALSCIAAQYQLYQDDREISQLKDLTGREIDVPDHFETFNAIQIVKSRYYQIYECNSREFDRVERLVKEISPNLDEWGRTIAIVNSVDIQSSVQARSANTKITKVNTPQSNQTTFTNEQVQTILLAERNNNFKLFFLMLFLVLIGGGVGISLAIRQQPQLVTNIPLSKPLDPIIPSPAPVSTLPPETANSSPAPIVTPPPLDTVKSEPAPVETPFPEISQDEAVSLVQKWLETKKSLFSPPFDRDSAASFMIGKAYRDKVRGPSSDGTPYSASEWLEKYGYYYSYGLQRIDAVKNFEISGRNAIIDIQITEDVSLYNSNGELQKLKSGLEQKTVRYVLVKEDESLKISDYNNLTTSERRL
jgi:ARC6-like, IMS domain